MIQFLKIETVRVFFIKLKDALDPVLGIFKKDYLSTVNDAIDFISGKSRRIQKTD